MREALAGLTVRGRAFVAAGVTAVVCAVLLGQPALTRVGVLVLALPLVTALVLGRSRYRLALVRTVSPSLVTAGQQAQVTLSLSKREAAPPAGCCSSRTMPYVLGTRPRFVLEGIGFGWHRQVGYQVRSDVRGRFRVRPMSVQGQRPLQPRRARPRLPHHLGPDRHPRTPWCWRRSRSAAPGAGRAATARVPSPPAAPGTSRCASTAAATTCARVHWLPARPGWAN